MRKRLFYLLVILLYVSGAAAWAQETGQVVASLNDEYIKEWLVIGPFFPDDLDTDFLADAGGEANIHPGEGDTVTTADGKTLTWRRYTAKGNTVSLLDAVGEHDNATAYAFCILQSEAAGDARIHLGNNRGVAVWINGKPAHSSPDYALLDSSVFEVKLKAGANRCLIKISDYWDFWGFAIRAAMLSPKRAVISGIVTDEKGNPIAEADVHLEQDGLEIAQTTTDASGSYRINIYPARGSYDVFATKGDRGDLRLGIPLREGERQTLNFTLKKALSIEGTLLMLDDMTPHVAVPVQAIRNGEAVATVLSDKSGKYQLINLRPGRYQVRCQVLGGYVFYGEEKARRPEGQEARRSEDGTVPDESISLRVRQGETLENMDFRFAPFKKGTWKNYNTLDGLAHVRVRTIHVDSDGVLWFGTFGGVSRYDGKEFVNFATKDGLVDDNVFSICRDPDGVLWFGTRGGVSRYDGNEFINFTTKDGLAHNGFNAIHVDPDGVMWFGTDGGVSRYDGNEFINFTTKDGLAYRGVNAIHVDPDGVMWFGTLIGVSRYDGNEFINFTTKDGLEHNMVNAIHVDPDGVMWFGTGGGVSRYDGNEFINFTTKDGLAHNGVNAIHVDPDGVMWFGTNGGVSRYDGNEFVNFTTEDGLVSDVVLAIHRDPDGVLWFGTMGGVSRYDGETLVNFTEKGGLVNDTVWAIHRDADGSLWFGTGSYYIGSNGGVSRYDGKEFVNLTPEDGLADDIVRAIHRDPDGIMWFGTMGGLSRYDGKEFVKFTTEDGLAHNTVWSIYGGPDGVLWFGTNGGVSRYNGREFVNFTTKDGLAGNSVLKIRCDPDGVMWFGTMGGGVSSYDGEKFVNFTTEDGLVNNFVETIYCGPDGAMWFGTNGGVSCYDGDAWVSLDTRDGLAGNWVTSIYQDADGFLWFATDKGVTRYRRSTTRPKVSIVAVTADQTYRDLSAIPAFAPGTRVTIEYSALDFKTVLEKRQYQYRLIEIPPNPSFPKGGTRETDSDWLRPTKEVSFDHTFKEPGTYTFQVKAIDRDLNYSDPESVEIRILPPPFYTRAGFIIGAILAAFLIPTVIYISLLVRQNRGQEFKTISNPYIVGNPVRTKDMFFGRESDFEFVRAKLAAGQSGLVIIFAGERRSGKTSILFQILEGALGEQFVPVLLDMQAMAVDSEAEFLEKMASGIDEAMVRMGHGAVPTEMDFYTGNPIRIFEGFMAQVMEILGDKSLLLLFDEYELIEAKMNDGVLRPDLITFFASQLEAHRRLSFIFTGSRHLDGRNREYWSILIGKSLYRPISFLSQQDALRLITEPVKDRVTYPGGIPERIVRLTAGQPFYTQVVCQNLMDRLNEVERTRIRQEDVDAVADELTDNPLPQMIYFWDGLRPEQHTVSSG